MLASTEAYGLTFTVPAGDTAVGAALRVHGEFARPEVDFLLACATVEAGVLLDVGANLGAITAPFALRAPKWSVIAIEPHQGLNDLLKANVDCNGLSNVRVVRAAAGEATQAVKYPGPTLANTGNFGDIGLHYPVSHCTVETDMVALDEIAPPDTRIVKVDVQGYEPQVLRGARRLLNEIRPMWFVEASTDPATSAEVVNAFWSAEYDLYWFYSPFVTANPARGGTPEDPAKGDANFVALPVGEQPPWPLPSVTAPTERRPSRACDYLYLKNYGY